MGLQSSGHGPLSNTVVWLGWLQNNRNRPATMMGLTIKWTVGSAHGGASADFYHALKRWLAHSTQSAIVICSKPALLNGLSSQGAPTNQSQLAPIISTCSSSHVSGNGPTMEWTWFTVKWAANRPNLAGKSKVGLCSEAGKPNV
jgi:hypothetical protein